MMATLALTLTRTPPVDDAIIGELSIAGVHECFTLESQPVAIPLGTYRVLITPSPRFEGAMLPILCAVPNRAGIRIHAGNTIDDTEGCILVGQEAGKTDVLQSRLALSHLQTQLAQALAHGDLVTIQVRDADV